MAKSGDIVNIYQKPITNEEFEGKAELICKIQDFSDGLEYWHVHFLGDIPKSSYERTIKTS